MSLLNEKIVYNADKSVNRTCLVKAAGHVFPDPSWIALREDPKDVLILFIADGKAKLTVSGGEYPLYRGDCVVFPPRKYSKLQSDAKTPPEVYWLRCGGDLVEAFIKSYFPNHLNAFCNLLIINAFPICRLLACKRWHIRG